MLFYKPSCPYCSEFMPIWYKIVNNLSNNVLYEEINCEKEYKKANEYQITSVPTIILLVNNEKKMYMGDRNYKDIMRFLKYNGINLIERTFEEFDSTGYSNDSNTLPNKNTSVCQSVTFNTTTDIAQDQYMFQIFNSDGQYGYAEGGYNLDKIMSPFTAAYSTIDSYLTSLPEGANIRDCANMYADQIRSFGLCDKKQLDNILQYQKDVSQGNATTLIDGTDYSSNNDVVTAIKKVCNL
jgi:thiol-disulfide isomerase/thioredoxin